jgi:hypothetical protein
MRSGHPADSGGQIDDFLSDPIVQKMMEANKVDRSALLAILVRTALKLREQNLELNTLAAPS